MSWTWGKGEIRNDLFYVTGHYTHFQRYVHPSTWHLSTYFVRGVKDSLTMKLAIYLVIPGTNNGWLTALDYRKSNLATEISQWSPTTAFLGITSVSWPNVCLLFDVCPLKLFNVTEFFSFLLFFICFMYFIRDHQERKPRWIPPNQRLFSSFCVWEVGCHCSN